MATKKMPQIVLKILALFMVIGGAVRLLANRGTFQSFMIENLWVSHPYFIYIYRVLGAFVIFAGVIIYMISCDPAHNTSMLKVAGFGFLLIGVVMVIAGHSLGMSFVHYAFDFIFSFFIAAVCFALSVRRIRN